MTMTAITRKSAFCALHGLHEISTKLIRRRRYNSAKRFVLRIQIQEPPGIPVLEVKNSPRGA